jgi:hypothetical protein
MRERFFASVLLSPAPATGRRPRCGAWLIALTMAALALAAPPTRAQNGNGRALLTRTGLPVVIVQAPETSWAVVQLHIRTAGESLTAEQAWGLNSFGAALARAGEGRGRPALERVSAAGGQTHLTRTLDSVVITDGLPATHLDEALKAMDARLRERRRLVPPVVPVATLAPTLAPPPPLVRQLMAPGHPYALPDDGPATPAVLTALADQLLRRENVVLVVVAPADPSSTLVRVNRWLRTPLLRGVVEVPAIGPLEGGRVALAPPDDPIVASLWLPLPAGEAARRAERRAALLVLADLLGGESGSAAALDWLAFRVHAREGAAGEQTRLNELEAASRGLDADAIAASRVRARTHLVRPTRQPERLALARGRAALFGLDDEAVDQALVTLSADAVRALATELVGGGRVMLRADPAAEGTP